jgi:hypothetical protein
MNEVNQIIFKSRQQMANEYGICPKTFLKVLKKHGIKLGKGLISPKVQILIKNKIGNPESS